MQALKKAYRIWRDQGFLEMLIRALIKIKNKKNAILKPDDIKLLVRARDVVDPQFVPKNKKPANKDPKTIAWVMSPPSDGGGGHQNIMRFMKYLQDAGYSCSFVLYSSNNYVPVDQVRDVVKKVEPELNADIIWIDDIEDFEQYTAVFATGWETAYPVAKYFDQAYKFYFVQDFEPFFYPHGSEYTLAENTYKFGFHGITAGGWLAKKLADDYGMKTDHYNFGANKELYQYTNKQPRDEIFFYARPVTTRRGFELGLMTLERVAAAMPDAKIVLAGWDVSGYKIPFKHENLKSLRLDQLSDVYNRCAAALVLSHTNMSLLPLELLACGTIPVVNDAPNNRLVSDNPFIAYTETAPDAMAQRIIDIVKDPNQQRTAKKAADSVKGQNWDSAGEKMVSVVNGVFS